MRQEVLDGHEGLHQKRLSKLELPMHQRDDEDGGHGRLDELLDLVNVIIADGSRDCLRSRRSRLTKARFRWR